MGQLNEDTFVDTDTTTLSSHTPTPSGGFTWSSAGEDGWIFSGVAITTGDGLEARCTASITPGSADYYVETELSVGASGYAGPVARRTADGTSYQALYDAATSVTTLSKRVSFTPTSLGTYSATLSSGDVVRIICNGTTISVKVNGVEQISVTDSDISGAGSAGLMMNDFDTGVDTWAYGTEDAATGNPWYAYAQQ